MSDLAGNIRAPKKAGGRTKIHSNCEGLSKDVIIAKNLRTPPGSKEDAKSRESEGCKPFDGTSTSILFLVGKCCLH